MSRLVTIYCPDCRGKFNTDILDVEERDILECELCVAEIEIMQLDPLKVRLFLEE